MTSATCVAGRCAGEAGVSGAHATTRERPLHYAATEPFLRPVSQRVGVVGAGMSGLATALALQLEGHRVSHKPRGFGAACGGGHKGSSLKPPAVHPRR